MVIQDKVLALIVKTQLISRASQAGDPAAHPKQPSHAAMRAFLNELNAVRGMADALVIGCAADAVGD